MTTKTDTPLMAGTRLFLNLLLIALYIVGAFALLILVAAPFVLLSETRPDNLAGSDIVLVFAAIVFLGMTIAFLHMLRKIVVSVTSGDPFSDSNSIRLVALAWLAMALWVAEFGFLLYEGLVLKAPSYATSPDFAAELINMVISLLTPLTLFVIARVFRHGAAMRADLEGTV